MDYKNILKKLAIGVAILLVGVAIGYSSKEPDVKIQEKEVEVVRKDIVTVIKEISKPDGSKETVTTITDKSKENKTSERTLEVVAERYWKANVGVGKNWMGQSGYHYSLGIERKIYKNLWIGAEGSTRGDFGISIGVEW